jgi:hypothetical protein
MDVMMGPDYLWTGCIGSCVTALIAAGYTSIPDYSLDYEYGMIEYDDPVFQWWLQAKVFYECTTPKNTTIVLVNHAPINGTITDLSVDLGPGAYAEVTSLHFIENYYYYYYVYGGYYITELNSQFGVDWLAQTMEGPLAPGEGYKIGLAMYPLLVTNMDPYWDGTKRAQHAALNVNMTWNLTQLNHSDGGGGGPPCRFPCHEEYIGDGMCDDMCMTPECGWDGGDCGSSGGGPPLCILDCIMGVPQDLPM